MGFGLFVHHIGTFLLLVATVLLIVTTISAPVVNDISLLKVTVDDGHFYFGTFGWCRTWYSGRGDECSSKHIGYNPGYILNDQEHTNIGDGTEDTAKALTRVMVLHPVGAGLCFIAFLICLGAGIVGSLIASLISVLAFIVTAVAVICDFVGFSLIKHHVDHSDGNNSTSAEYGVAIWTALAAGIAALLAAILVFVTCCAGRSRDKRRHSRTRKVKGWNDDLPPGV